MQKIDAVKDQLAGLSVFRCKKSMHGRPSWELERTKKFAAWCIRKCQGNAVSMSALESAEWFVSRRRPSFLFWTEKQRKFKKQKLNKPVLV